MIINDTNLEQLIKNELLKIIDNSWVMIILSIKIESDISISYNGEYINNLGETKQLFTSEGILNDNSLVDIFCDYYKINKSKQKWNKLKLEFFKDDDLDIEVEWDQEIENEFKKQLKILEETVKPKLVKDLDIIIKEIINGNTFDRDICDICVNCGHDLTWLPRRNVLCPGTCTRRL